MKLFSPPIAPWLLEKGLNSEIGNRLKLFVEDAKSLGFTCMVCMGDANLPYSQQRAAPCTFRSGRAEAVPESLSA